MIDFLEELTITRKQLHQIKAFLYCIVEQDNPLLPSAAELHKALPETTFFTVPHGTHVTTTRKDMTKRHEMTACA